MSRLNNLINGFIKAAQMPVVENNPEILPMPRPTRNRPLGKIPLRKPVMSRISWQWDKASHPNFNRSVFEKKRGRTASLTQGIESISPLSNGNGTPV